MTSEEKITSVLNTFFERELLNANVSPPVEEREDASSGWCRMIAFGVYDELGRPEDVQVLQGFMGLGDNHYWLKYNGKHFDAESPQGVQTPEDLDFFGGMTVKDMTERTDKVEEYCP
jgi:hypothetical protein